MKKKRKKKVYLVKVKEEDWALGKNRYYHSKALKDLEVPLVNNISDADIIYAVWWRKRRFLKWKFKLKKKLFKLSNWTPQNGPEIEIG